MFKTREYYKNITSNKHDYNIMLKNFIKSFIFGGIVSLIGQVFISIYSVFIDDVSLVNTYMMISIISILLS